MAGEQSVKYYAGNTEFDALRLLHFSIPIIAPNHQLNQDWRAIDINKNLM